MAVVEAVFEALLLAEARLPVASIVTVADIDLGFDAHDADMLIVDVFFGRDTVWVRMGCVMVALVDIDCCPHVVKFRPNPAVAPEAKLDCNPRLFVALYEDTVFAGKAVMLTLRNRRLTDRPACTVASLTTDDR